MASSQVKDGEWIRPRKRGYLMQCCDCALVHRLNFQIVEDHPTRKALCYRVRNRTLHVEFQAFRDETRTRARRKPGHIILCTPRTRSH